MTEFHLLSAMTYINSAYIDSAQKKLGYIPPAEVPRTRHRGGKTLRRLLTLAAAVMILMSVLFTTALAVNQDFRDFVFSFFRAEEPEQIPSFTPETELSAEDMFVEPEVISIGGVIEGTYVHTPRASNARNGIFKVCTDEIELRQGSHYDAYYEENGEFYKLEEHTFCENYTVLGNDIHVEFQWVEHNGMVSMTYVEPNAEDFRTYNQGGSADSALFYFLCTRETEAGDRIGTYYPVLLNLHTGELKDVLAGTGAEDLPHIANCATNKDQTYMLLVQDEGNLYCADLVRKKLHDVDALSGEHAEKCSLIGDILACWRLENGGYYKGWSINLKTLERRELFQGMRDVMPIEEPLDGFEFIEGFDTARHSGNMYAGTGFALLVEEGQVYVMDLRDGSSVPIEGFTWPEGEYDHIQRQPSPDGKKLLLYGWTPGGDYRYIGVVDFEQKRYVEFSRTYLGENGDMSITWFDPETIVIHSAATDLCSDFYVYRLVDPKQSQNVPAETGAYG